MHMLLTIDVRLNRSMSLDIYLDHELLSYFNTFTQRTYMSQYNIQSSIIENVRTMIC